MASPTDGFVLRGRYLSPVVNDSDDQGWEEITDCSLTSMLRYANAVLPFPLVALG